MTFHFYFETDRAKMFIWKLHQACISATICRPLGQKSNNFPTFCRHTYSTVSLASQDPRAVGLFSVNLSPGSKNEVYPLQRGF